MVRDLKGWEIRRVCFLYFSLARGTAGITKSKLQRDNWDSKEIRGLGHPDPRSEPLPEIPRYRNGLLESLVEKSWTVFLQREDIQGG